MGRVGNVQEAPECVGASEFRTIFSQLFMLHGRLVRVGETFNRFADFALNCTKMRLAAGLHPGNSWGSYISPPYPSPLAVIRGGEKGNGKERVGNREGKGVKGWGGMEREAAEGGESVGKGRDSSTWISVQGPQVPSYATAPTTTENNARFDGLVIVYFNAVQLTLYAILQPHFGVAGPPSSCDLCACLKKQY